MNKPFVTIFKVTLQNLCVRLTLTPFQQAVFIRHDSPVERQCTLTTR
jgi:hypothetical protein